MLCDVVRNLGFGVFDSISGACGQILFKYIAGTWGSTLIVLGDPLVRYIFTRTWSICLVCAALIEC